MILNPAEQIIIYKHESTASNNQKAFIHYYFSHGAMGDMIELTLVNLKNEFPYNHKFHEALDAEFESDLELILFDAFHNEYRINRLYATNS